MFDSVSQFLNLSKTLYSNYGNTVLGDSHMHPVHAILPFVLLQCIVSYISRGTNLLHIVNPCKNETLNEWLTFGVHAVKCVLTLALSLLSAICIQEKVYWMTHNLYDHMCEFEDSSYQLFLFVEADPLYCRVGPMKASFAACTLLTLALLRDSAHANWLTAAILWTIETLKTLTLFNYFLQYFPTKRNNYAFLSDEYLLEVTKYDAQMFQQQVQVVLRNVVSRMVPECLRQMCKLQGISEPETTIVSESEDVRAPGLEAVSAVVEAAVEAPPRSSLNAEARGEEGFDFLAALLADSKLKSVPFRENKRCSSSVGEGGL